MSKTTSKIDKIDDLEDIKFELESPPKVKKGAKPLKKEQYVNNKELQEAFVEYYNLKEKWIADGKEGVPPLSDKIGKAILDIAYRRTYSHNFIGYTNNWKEEMISDAIITCCKYAHNYNPIKYNNPFAYITQLVNNAIISRIKTEKKHTYIKYKMFDKQGGFAAYEDETSDMSEEIQTSKTMFTDYLEFIDDYEEKNFSKTPKEEDEYLGILEFVQVDDEEGENE